MAITSEDSRVQYKFGFFWAAMASSEKKNSRIGRKTVNTCSPLFIYVENYEYYKFFIVHKDRKATNTINFLLFISAEKLRIQVFPCSYGWKSCVELPCQTTFLMDRFIGWEQVLHDNVPI